MYVMPGIHDVLDCLQAADYFSTLDQLSSYSRILTLEAHKDKRGFSTTNGLYELNATPFRLRNGPTNFELIVGRVLRGLQ